MTDALFPIRKDLLDKLHNANSEATVRQLVIEQLDCDDFKLEEGRSDALHKNILIEFKHDVDMQHIEGERASVLAQALYYCHNFYIDGKRVPPYIALIDKDEFVFYERSDVESIYKDSTLFLQGSPSNPDKAVIEKCKHVDSYDYIFTDTQEKLDRAFKHLRQCVHSDTLVLDDITEYNVLPLYDSWIDVFTKFLNHKGKENRPHVFRKDCCEEREIFVIESLLHDEVMTIEFNLDNEIAKIERCTRSKYAGFWRSWKRIKDSKQEKAIFQKAADLFKMEDRRRKGQFYTPTNLARHGWAYLEKELGENFWFDGTWRIWDCCCGEGGLAINVIPNSALQYTYLSSLDAGEVDFVKKHLPMCKKVWQMDFLNTHMKDFPDEIKRDMANDNIKWLFFINPPYGEGSSGKATDSSEWYKKGVSLSLVKAWMKNDDLSIESKEKYAQFLYRIAKEFKGKYVMGCYTTMKAFVSKEYVNLRKFWRPVFKGGLICCANKWHQGKGMFPSAFSVFDCREKGKWREMEYNVLEFKKGYGKGIFKGKKSFTQEDPKRSFRQYFFPNEKLPNDELTVVQSNGLKTFGGKHPMNRYRPKGTLATGRYISGYMRQRDHSRCIVSGTVVTHPVFINKGNYRKALSGFGLYWSVTHTWINHEDTFLAPSRSLTPQEESDAILYALMCPRNRTTTAKMDETIITTKEGRVINGGINVKNELNPFDENMFDWSNCSTVSQEVLKLYKHYLDNIVRWHERDTIFGKGEWLGLFQYHRLVNIPKELVNAIEKLRQAVEQTALELCF
jgi:predicted RNA methylase